MEITLYPDADAAYIRIREGKPNHTNEVDGGTFVDVDTDGIPLYIQFLYVSDGADCQQLPGLTDQENQRVSHLLQESGIEVTPSARTPNRQSPEYPSTCLPQHGPSPGELLTAELGATKPTTNGLGENPTLRVSL